MNAQTLLTLYHSVALVLEWPQPGLRLNSGTEETQPQHGAWGQGWAMITAGLCHSGVSEVAQISDSGCITTVYSLIHRESTRTQLALQCSLTTRFVQQGLGEVIYCKGQRELTIKDASEWSKGKNYGCLHGQSIGDSSNL